MSVAANNERALPQHSKGPQRSHGSGCGIAAVGSLVAITEHSQKRQGWEGGQQTLATPFRAGVTQISQNAARTGRSRGVTGGTPNGMAASYSRTRPEVDEAVGLPGGIPQQNAARTGRSGGDWRHPEWIGRIPQQTRPELDRAEDSASIVKPPNVTPPSPGANWTCCRGQYDPATAVATANCANDFTVVNNFLCSAKYVSAVIKSAFLCGVSPFVAGDVRKMLSLPRAALGALPMTLTMHTNVYSMGE
ncbi:hypothetical protein Purlil1_12361 [Purpureocillium lilacinum]|uniref:Uncharacterized protein n=1 Tax=Purpureocillium lilacinum TaxID=33203 RepID=A0ABR0BGZ8_PURLI|nr:hypothetical protein Purlil1_12361 [Purpureocillium lilacinum]